MALRVQPSDQAHVGGTLSATAPPPPGVTLRASLASGATSSAPGILPEENQAALSMGPQSATLVVLHAAPAPGWLRTNFGRAQGLWG